jgi:exodeoxyribonuclease-5
MINRFLMSAIEEAYEEWGVPFIFMGDPAQLPPVGEISSPVFSIPNGYRLTEVLRYGNSMLDLATRIRDIVDHPFPSIRIETNPPVFRLGKPAWMARINDNLDLIRTGDAKIIAWRNVKVDEYNQIVRREIFGAEAKKSIWLPDDKVVAKAPIKNLDDAIVMQNAEEGTILEVVVGQHPKFGEYEIFNILIEHESGRKITLRTLTPKSAWQVGNRLNELSMEAKNGARYKWKEFWDLKEAFHEVKHAYAITSHMSQGSSYRKVFVDLDDIMLNRNRSEAFRSLYVAATRQREEIYFA